MVDTFFDKYEVLLYWVGNKYNVLCHTLSVERHLLMEKATCVPAIELCFVNLPAYKNHWGCCEALLPSPSQCRQR